MHWTCITIVIKSGTVTVVIEDDTGEVLLLCVGTKSCSRLIIVCEYGRVCALVCKEKNCSQSCLQVVMD